MKKLRPCKEENICILLMIYAMQANQYQNQSTIGKGIAWWNAFGHVFHWRTTIVCTTLLHGSAFDPLKNPKVLENYTIFHGIMTWMDGEIDIAPETMYADSYPYTAQNVNTAMG